MFNHINSPNKIITPDEFQQLQHDRRILSPRLTPGTTGFVELDKDGEKKIYQFVGHHRDSSHELYLDRTAEYSQDIDTASLAARDKKEDEPITYDTPEE